jgi:CheY-like chemotaxis protein
MNRSDSKGLSCPQCGWGDVRVSYHARFWDYALAFLVLAPMRCRKCRLRFYRPWFLVRAKGAPEVETRKALPDSIPLGDPSASARWEAAMLPEPALAGPLSTPLPLPARSFGPPHAGAPHVGALHAGAPHVGALHAGAPQVLQFSHGVKFRSAARLRETAPFPDVAPILDAGTPPPRPFAAAPIAPAPPTVLLIDEDAAMRRLFATLLKRQGYSVRHAEFPSEATAEINSNKIDVVIANLSEAELSIGIREWRSAHPDLSIIAFARDVQNNGRPAAEPQGSLPQNNLLMLPFPSRPRMVVSGVQTMMKASRATRCAPPLSAHTPRTAIHWRP